MLLPAGKAICIDIRSSAEVMLYGAAEDADVHIPYLGAPCDEWNVYLQSYRSYTNTSFINSVFELIIDYGLYRDSPIVLITRLYRKGILAESVLEVAGYSNVQVESREGNSDCQAVQKRDRQITQGRKTDLMEGIPYILDSDCVVH
jgi:hypothetical protein